MKILLALPEYPPDTIGGGGAVFENLAINYQKLGNTVAVAYGNYKSGSFSKKPLKFRRNGIIVYKLPEIPYPEKFPALKTRMPLNFYSLLKFRQVLLDFKPDAVHLHGYGFLPVDLMALICKLSSVKYVLTIHGWPARHLDNSLIKLPTQVYLNTLARTTLKNAYSLTAVSAFLKKNVFLKTGLKTAVIPNGINPKDYSVKNPKEVLKLYQKIKNDYKIQKNTTILLSLGRIEENKGFEKVLARLSLFRKHACNFVYLIGGSDGGFQKTLQKKVKSLGLYKKVVFLGQLSILQRNFFLDKSDIVAVPSEIEGFSLTALEGMYFGKTLLIGNSEAVADLASNYRNIINLDRFTKTDLIKKSKPKQKFDMTVYSWQEIAKNYLKLLKEVQND